MTASTRSPLAVRLVVGRGLDFGVRCTALNRALDELGDDAIATIGDGLVGVLNDELRFVPLDSPDVLAFVALAKARAAKLPPGVPPAVRARFDVERLLRPPPSEVAIIVFGEAPFLVHVLCFEPMTMTAGGLA